MMRSLKENECESFLKGQALELAWDKLRQMEIMSRGGTVTDVSSSLPCGTQRGTVESLKSRLQLLSRQHASP